MKIQIILKKQLLLDLLFVLSVASQRDVDPEYYEEYYSEEYVESNYEDFEDSESVVRKRKFEVKEFYNRNNIVT